MSASTRAAAAAEHQFLVRLCDGHTACIALPAAASVLDLQAHIERSSGIPASSQRLVCNGRLLHTAVAEDELDGPLSTGLACLRLVDSQHAFSHVTVLLSLSGGKGGFGSLLRATTARVGVKRTSDFSAMRDLHGRRMRHVEQDRELQRWEDDMAGKSEEEKKTLRMQLTAKMTRIKRGQRVEDRRPCRWGALCKYKYKCRGSHPEEVKEADGKESGHMGGLGMASWQAAVVDEEEVIDDVQAALRRRSARRETEEQQDESDSGEDEVEDEESEEEQQVDEHKEGSSSSSHRRAWDDELFFDEDGGDDEVGDASETKRADLHVEEKEEKQQRTTRQRSQLTSEHDDENESHDAPYGDRHAHDTHEPRDEQKAEKSSRPHREEKEARDEKQSWESAPVITQPTSSSLAAVAGLLTPASPPSYAAIELSQHSTAASLQAYGLEHLRYELDQVGLKSGGTLAERAERLFMLKDRTLQQLPKKLLKR